MRIKDAERILSGKYHAMPTREYDIYFPHKTDVTAGFFVELSAREVMDALRYLALRKIKNYNSKRKGEAGAK